MTKKIELVSKLKESPNDKTAMDTLVGFFIQRGDFQALYEGLQEVAESIADRAVLLEFRRKLTDVVRKHVDSTEDKVLSANLKLRLAGMLYDKASDPKEALILVTEAFEQLPSEEVAQRAVNMLNEMKLLPFVVQLLKQKAGSQKGKERYPDTLFQLGHAALSTQNITQARQAFDELVKEHPAWAQKAKEGLAQVDSLDSELTAAAAELRGKLAAATDIERPVLKARLGKTLLSIGQGKEGIALLEEVLKANPDEETFMQLASAYKDLEEWRKLLLLVEQWAESTLADETRKELLKDRVRLQALRLKDRKKGYAALGELIKRYPGAPDVVEFGVQFYSECEDYDALAELLGKARQDTKDRDQERRYLEWEAALKWRKLGDQEEAEKLYRRIKSIDPRNEPALLFYEEYYRKNGDSRKLYTVLSTRQSLVPDSQKVEILKSMAEIAAKEMASPDRAIDSLKKVLALEPGDEEAFAALSQLLEESRRWHAVIEHYTAKVERLDVSQKELKLEYLAKIKDIYGSADKLPVPEMVISIYRRILQIDGENLEAIEALGDYYRKNNRWGELTEILELKSRLEPNKTRRIELLKETARILIDFQHQEGAAIPYLEQVVELDPKDSDVLALMAKGYRGRGEFEKFFEVGKKQLAIVRGQERKDLLEELATIAMERLHAEDEACDLLEKLLAAAPKHPWAFRRLSQLYGNLERHQDQAELLKREIDRTPGVKGAELKQKLGILYAEKLDRLEEARGLFEQVVQEDPANRPARQYLQRILVQAGSFFDLQEMFQKEKNMPGLLRFLEECRGKESDPERIKTVGLEMVRVARDVLKDKARAQQVLESLLEQLPADPEVATLLLSFYPAKKMDLDVAKALAVVADNASGPEAREAGLRLAQVLEKVGEFEASYVRTLGLFLVMAREGDLGLLSPLTDRAEKSGSLEGLARVLQEMQDEPLPADSRSELVIQTANIFKSRLKDVGRAHEVLKAELARQPDSLPILRELERVYMGTSEWDRLEATVRAMADLMLDLEQKKEELHKLARLYEEIVGNPEKAEQVHREIRELDPADEEAFSGLKRILEELEKWEDLASVLEEEIPLASPEKAREDLLQLAGVHYEKLKAPETAAETWARVLERWPDDEAAWEKMEHLFNQDEALPIVLPLLEKKHRQAKSWSALVDVLAKKAHAAEDERERFETLGQCAQILDADLAKPAEVLSYLVSMAELNASEAGLLEKLEDTGRRAEQPDTLRAVYQGLLGIGESDFAPREPLEQSLEQTVALLLATLAEEAADRPVAIAALKRARLSLASELPLFARLETLLEEEQRWEELFALAEEKLEYVWEPEGKAALYARIADLLTDRLDREEQSIPWVEELRTARPHDQQVAERIEQLYLKYERWPELAALLNRKLTGLEGEERRGVAYQLAVIERDHLGDVAGSFRLLNDILAEEPDNETYVEALSFLLGMKEAEGYDSVVLKAVAVLEPIARTAEAWERLAGVLDVKAQRSPELVDSAHAYHDLGLVYRDKLNKPKKALEAFALAVEKNPGAEDFLADLLASGEKLKALDVVIQALEAGIGGIETATEAAALAMLAETVRQHTDDTGKTARAYERLIELRPDEIKNYAALDALYEVRDDPAGRIRVLSELRERLEGREQAEVCVTVADLQLGQGRREDGIDSLYKALKNPDLLAEERRHQAFHLMNEALEAEERWFDLTEILQAQLKYAEDAEQKKALLFHLAQLQEEKLDNPDRAVEHFYAILDLDAVERIASRALARLLESTGKFERLEDLLSTQAELVDEFEEKSQLLLKLARLRLSELGQPERAVDALAVLVEQNVQSGPPIKLLEEIVESFPDAGFRASQLLETVYSQARQFDKLAEIYKTQIDRFPEEIDRVQRYRDLALVYEKQFRDIDTAFLYVSQAFKLEPTSEAIHEQLVSYARDRGGFDGLFDIYLDVLVQLDEAAARNNLRRKMISIYHDEIKDYDHAEQIYRDMLDDEHGNEFAIERLQALYTSQESWGKLVEILRTRADTAKSDKARIAALSEIAVVHREKTAALAEALDTLEEILLSDGTHWDAYRGIESICFDKGDITGVTAILRRELAARPTPEEKKEVRLRLGAILANEQGEFEPAVDEVAATLAQFDLDDSALQLLDEILEKWEAPTQKALDLAVEAKTRKKEWDGLVALFQRQASRAQSTEERLDWFEKIYAIRIREQQDERGAFAACKVMVLVDPGNRERMERLATHAANVGETDDLIAFLNTMLEHEGVPGTETETVFHAMLARAYETYTDDSAAAIVHFEQVQEGSIPALAAEAKDRLRSLYQGTEAWPKYVALMEGLAAESSDPKIRRQFLLEAGQVASVTLEDHDKAYHILSSLAQEFPDDDLVQDRYEALLVTMQRTEDLESQLKDRVGRTRDPKARAGLRVKLASLLLNLEGRISESIEELLLALDENPEGPAAWAILESLVAADGTPTEDRLRIASTLEARYPESTPVEKRRSILELHLSLEQEGAEQNRLHLDLGKLLDRTGDYPAAFLHFSQSLRLFPGVREVEEKVESLAQQASLLVDLKELLLQLVEAADEEALRVRYLLKAADLERSKLNSKGGAISTYERVLEIDSLNREALSNLDSMYEEAGEFEKLSGILEKEIGILPDQAARIGKTLALARLLTEKLGNIPQARRWWEELLPEKTTRREAFQNLETVYREQEEWELMSDLLLQEKDEAGDDDERKLILTKLAYLQEERLSNMQEAFHWYQELLRLDPALMAALRGAKRCAQSLEDWDTVAQVDEKLLSSASEEEGRALQQELAGLYLENLGHREKGVQYLQSLLAMPPVAKEAKELALRHIADPEIGLQVSLSLEPLLEELEDWTQLVHLYETQLEQFREIEEKAAVAAKAADVLLDRLSDPEKAFSLMGSLLAMAPTSKPLNDKLCDMAGRASDWSRCVQVMEEASQHAAGTEQKVEVFTRLAETCDEKLHDFGRALQWYRCVLDEEARNGNALVQIERLLQTEEKWDDLVAHYEATALEFDGEERIPYLLRLGFLKEEKLEDPGGAVHAYREILSISPDNEAALTRLDRMLDNPILGLAAIEILEPIYRSKNDAPRLARLLTLKAGEVEGSMDRAQLLAEAADLLAAQGGREVEAFETFIMAIRQKRFDTGDILSKVGELADKLNRWQDLAGALETVCADPSAAELRPGLLRRLALIYMEKLGNASLAELRLREILQEEPEDAFALNMLVQALDRKGEKEEQLAVLEKLGDVSVEADRKRGFFERAAELAVDLERFDKAASFLGMALKVAPTDGDLMARLADVHRRRESWNELVELLESRSNLVETAEASQLLLEAALIAKENLQAASRALALARQVLEKDESNKDALLIMTGILREQGKLQELLGALEKLVSLQEGEEKIESLWQLKELGLELGDAEGAIAYVQKILEIEPANTRAVEAKIELLKGSENLYNLVTMYEEQAKATDDLDRKVELLYEAAITLADEIGDAATALEKLASIRKMKPDHLKALQKLAQIKVQQQEFEGALQIFRDLVAQQPDPQKKLDAMKAAARLALDDLGDPETALKFANQALEAAPDEQEVFDFAALCLERLERHEELSKLLLDRIKKASDSGPKAALCKRLAVVYRDGLKREDLFLNWTEEAHRAEEDPELVDELLAHYRKQKKVDRVAPLLEWKVAFLTARKQLKEVPQLLFELASIMEDQGDSDKALDAYRRCTEVDTSFLPGLYRMACLLSSLGRNDEALPVYQTLLLRINELESAEEKVAVYLSLGRIYLDKGDKKKAKTYLTRLLTLDKKHKQAKDLLATLS